MIRRDGTAAALPWRAVSADPRHRRAATLVLAWAIAEIALAIVALVVAVPRDARHHRAPITSPPATSPTAPPTPPAQLAVTPDAPAPAPAGAASARSRPQDGEAPTAPDASPTTVAPSGVVPSATATVSCRPDLTLAASPDAAYSFLCTRGETPLSWSTDSIRLYTTGLTPAQTAALPVALEQWQARARFTVTRVNAAADADVVVTATPLANNEDGYTAMHYVCAATCAYDHADVQLASDVALTATSWISTILHELGHVAGLNHVTRHSEVMYPEIDARSPVLYGPGDLAGFQELAKVRSAP